MRQISGFCAAMVVFWAHSVEANSTMEILYENTLVMTYEGENQFTEPGGQIRSLYNADGTITTDNDLTIRWTLDGEKLCAEISDGSAGCVVLPEGKSVGDSWRGTDVHGTPVTFAIEAGRAE